MAALYTARALDDTFVTPYFSSTQLELAGQPPEGARDLTAWELLLVPLLGAVGGVCGAAINLFVLRLGELRQRFVDGSKLRQLAAACAVAALSTTVRYWLSEAWPCETLEAQNNDEPPKPFDYIPHELDETVSTFGCGADGRFNPLASLLLVGPHEAGNALLATNVPRLLPPGALLIGFAFWFLGSALAANLASPGGLLLPLIITGGCLGRLFGWLRLAVGEGTASELDFQFGRYAVFGATALLAGSGRIRLFITVVGLEARAAASRAPPASLRRTAAAGTLVARPRPCSGDAEPRAAALHWRRLHRRRRRRFSLPGERQSSSRDTCAIRLLTPTPSSPF